MSSSVFVFVGVAVGVFIGVLFSLMFRMPVPKLSRFNLDLPAVRSAEAVLVERVQRCAAPARAVSEVVL